MAKLMNPNVEALVKAFNSLNEQGYEDIFQDEYNFHGYGAQLFLNELEKQGYVLVKVNFNEL